MSRRLFFAACLADRSPDQTIVAGHFFELGEPGSSEHPDRLYVREEYVWLELT